MKNRAFLPTAFLAVIAASTSLLFADEKPSAPVPAGYKLLYSQDFAEADSIKQFEFTNPAKWVHNTEKGEGALQFLGAGGYKPAVRSPFVIGLIADRAFGDFVLEANVLQTGREYGHRDTCVFFGFTDPSKFYYVHIATKTDNHAHNIFIVNDKPRTKISTKTTKGVQWDDKWHKVRIERVASEGTIKIFFDDMTSPIMLASDTTFPSGQIGFGTFDDSGIVDNVRIWGPEVSDKPTSVFRRK